MKENSTAIDDVVRSVLAKAGVMGAKELAAWKTPQDDIRRLSRRDYQASLRRQLSFERICELIDRAKDVWPHFNLKVLGPPSPQFFSHAAGALHLHLKAARYNSLALYGFYLDRMDSRLGRPLIYINSAHHALAKGTAFCHEVGHHFCTELGKGKHAGPQFYFDAAYSEHLCDQGELLADVVVSLAGYPKPAAAAIFGKRHGRKIANHELDHELIERTRRHIEDWYGFDFSAPLSARQNLQYLAGLLHYAKLRAALLEEFEV